MNAALLNTDLIALLLLGLGAPVYGLARLTNQRVVGFGVSTLFAAGAIASLATGASVKIWLLCSVFALGYPAAAAAGHYRDTLLRWLASRRAAALALVAAGPLCAGAWAAWIDFSTAAPTADLVAGRELPALPPEPVVVSMTGFTDRGQAVPLATRPVEDLAPATLHQAERLLTTGHFESIIRTDGPDPNYNCHGWVFSDGQFWIRNDAVESILTDNDYRKVSKPTVGDVIVYRDGDGRVLHTGMVRLLNRDTPIVESKWGHVGRFLHPAGEQPYGELWEFYRSPRKGHLIRLGDSPSSNDGIAE